MNKFIKNNWWKGCLLLCLFLPSFVGALSAPSCTISISPSTIKKGEDASSFFKAIGPIDKVVYTVDGILGYMGGSTHDISAMPPDSMQYIQERQGYETGPTKIRPMSIGTGSETIYIYGPGGSSSCTASITVTSNDLYEEGKTIIFSNPVTYHLNGNEKFRSCPLLSCGTTVWGTTNGTGTITHKNGDWYFFSIVEEYVKGYPYNVSGWLPSSLVPHDINEKLQNQNSSAFEADTKKEVTPNVVSNDNPNTKNFISQFTTIVKQWIGKKEIIYPILTMQTTVLYTNMTATCF